MQGNKACSAVGFIKVISQAFIRDVSPVFSVWHWEDGNAISLTFLSELVFEPLDDSDKCRAVICYSVLIISDWSFQW